MENKLINTQWIGSDREVINTDGLKSYTLSLSFQAQRKTVIGIALNARNKDNYILIELDLEKRELKITEHCDNAFTTSIPTVEQLGRTYELPELAVINTLTIQADYSALKICMNGITVTDEAEILPKDIPNFPRKQALMKLGFRQEKGRVLYKSIRLEAEGKVICEDSFENANGILSALGEMTDDGLAVEGCFELVNPVPLLNLRRVFIARKKIKKAVMYASARGFYDVYVNGEKINNGYYNPGFTDYRKRIQYQTYDITDKLRDGTNVVGAVVAKGYYTGFVGYHVTPMVYGRENSFIARLVTEYEDGTTEVIVTDKAWQLTDKGAANDADYQQGEHHDARLEFDWNDLSDTRWRECGIKPPPGKPVPTNGVLSNEEFELSAEIGPEAVIERILKPVCKPREIPKGCLIYDFGQNMVGTIRLRLNGKRGQSIKLRYGETCYRDGRIYIENLRSAANTDTYVFSGKEDGEIFEPTFTEHGFRYVEVSGNGMRFTGAELRSMVTGIEGLVITNTPERTGYFECSNEDINKLQSNIEWGQRGNSLLVFTDCPQRNERMGWTGDAQVFARTAAYNMNVKEFTNKWLLDVKDAQLMYNRNGAVPDTAPLGGDNRPMGGCAGWGDAAVIVPWEMYMAYGDVSVLADNYDVMKGWVDYQSRSERQNFGERTVNGKAADSDLASAPFIQVQQSRGDHLAYDRSTPFILTATAYAAYVSRLLSETARILGIAEDAEKYMNRFENIKKAFNEAWVREDGSIAYWGEQSIADRDIDGNIINKTYYSHDNSSLPSQTAYAVAIDFGLIPEEKLVKAAKYFKKTLDKNNGRLSVGFLGISHLAPALTKAGLTDCAFSLLEETGNPSWLYSVKNYATTIWERWSSYIAETDTFGDVSMNSFNHYAYGAIGEWMMSTIAGIKPGKPGYEEIIIEPHTGGSLTYAKAWHKTPRGIVRSEWERTDDKVKYSIEIPENTKTVMRLPDGRSHEIRSRKHEIVIRVKS